MKNFFLALTLFFLFHQDVSATVCYEITGGTQSVTISLVPNSNYTSPPFNTFSSGQFTLGWDVSHGANVIQSISSLNGSLYTYDPAGGPAPELVNGVYYQRFGFSSSWTQTLMSGASLDILAVSFNTAEGTADFEIFETPPIIGGAASLAGFFGDEFASDGCTLTAIGVPLPVELYSFNVSKKQEDGLLEWITVSEEGVSHFDVERSFDGRSWETIGKVMAEGTSAEEQTYSFVDKAVGRDESLKDMVYYRLNIKDFDLTAEYSPIESISFESVITDPDLYPNPTNGLIMISIESKKNAHVDFYLTNALGEVFFLARNAVAKGENTFDFDLSKYPSGVYIIKMGLGNQTLLERVVKE